MFTGIVQYLAKVVAINRKPGLLSLTLQFPQEALHQLARGASVAINGVCLTVVDIQGECVNFDLIAETLAKTTFDQIQLHEIVHIERSLKIGDEIGGHLLSGHIPTTAKLINITPTENNLCLQLQTSSDWIKYIFPKGYIALAGVSLTVVDVNPVENTFSVHLIPETIKRTLFGNLKINDRLNIEIDTQTLTIVDTVERVLGKA